MRILSHKMKLNLEILALKFRKMDQIRRMILSNGEVTEGKFLKVLPFYQL